VNNLLKSWILGIVCASFIAAIMQAITPEIRAKRVVTLACGVLIMVAVAKPIINMDYSGISLYQAQLKADGAALAARLDETNENLTLALIERSFAAYISDKGKALGVEITAVEVSLTADREPESVAITALADAEQRFVIEREVAVTFGVERGKIFWTEG